MIVVAKSGPDGNALYRLADPKCKTWNNVGDMTQLLDVGSCCVRGSSGCLNQCGLSVPSALPLTNCAPELASKCE